MNLKAIFLFPLLAACLFLAVPGETAPVDKLRSSVTPARVRLVLDSKDRIAYKATKTKNRIEVALPDSSVTAQEYKIKDDAVKSARLLSAGETGKLVIDLNRECQYKIYQLVSPHRLVIDLFRINIVREDERLAKGVVYSYLQDEMNGRQIQAYLLSIAPDAKYELLPFSAAGAYNGRGKLSEIAAQEKILAAINASYFDTDGWVIGSVKSKGGMLAADEVPRSGYASCKQRAFIAQDIAYQGAALLPDGRSLAVKGMNRARINDDLVLYNPAFAPSTKTNRWGREIRIVNNRVTENSTAGNMSINPESVVLSAHGSNAAALAQLQPGMKVRLRETLGSADLDAADIVVSGGPLLLEDGRVHVRSAEEKIPADIAKGRAPRTALGIKKDGSILLLVVDGRSDNSAGLTLEELATYLLRLGARDAVNFDGGGSSAMVVKGKLVNKPSDGRERKISIGLGLFKK